MIEHANALPAPTWHRLGVNDVDIELPDDLAFARQVEVQCAEGLLGDEGAFDAALLSMADSFPVAATPSAARWMLRERVSRTPCAAADAFSSTGSLPRRKRPCAVTAHRRMSCPPVERMSSSAASRPAAPRPSPSR